jgi:transposase
MCMSVRTGERFTVGRDGKGLEELIERLRTLVPQLITIEATGGFETIAAAAIAGAALPLVIVNPAQVRYFAQAVGKRAKTDPIDAEVIARFAEAVKPKPRPCRMSRHACLPNWLPAGVRSLR